jgi:hypothetical protein
MHHLSFGCMPLRHFHANPWILVVVLSSEDATDTFSEGSLRLSHADK